MKTKFRALTPKQKEPQDIEINNTWNNFGANLKQKSEFYCKRHMIDRLLNYCHQDTLIDVVVTSGTELHFTKCDPENNSCKENKCDQPAEFRIDRQ